MTTFKIIEQIAGTSSLKEKQSIMEKNSSNEVLRLAFLYAENPRFNFWIKADSSLINSSGVDDLTVGTFKKLDRIINREYTGDAARSYLQSILSSLDQDAQTILIRIVNRDLRCNAGTSLANKVWNNLIPEYPVMLASKFDAKAEKHLKQFENGVGFVIQNKEDGGRLIVSVSDDGSVSYRSRNGSALNMFGKFDADLKKFKGYTFDGELIVKTASGVPDRKTGNGYYTKAVRGTLTKEEADKFTYKIWDMVSNKEYDSGVGKEGYEDRFNRIINSGVSGSVEYVESLKVQTLDECKEFYAKMRLAGQEGAIIKVANSIYEDTRSKNMVKLKAVESADLICVGTEEGTGKFEGMIGALICETSDGLLRTKVGTGLKDADRDPSIQYVGKIIELNYNEVITSKSKDTASLFLPVYVQIRHDKNVANAIGELK